MSSRRRPPTVAETNRTYFQSLARTRASLERLATIAVLIIVLLGITNIGPFNPTTVFSGSRLVSYIVGTNVAVMCLCAVLTVLSAFKPLVYRHQVAFSAVMAFMAAALVYGACLLTVPIVAFVGARPKEASAALLEVAGLIAVVLLIGSVLVHVLLLRRRLRVGHSDERTLGNYMAVSGSNRSKMLWVTFGVVAVVPNVLTLGQYLLNSFGLIALVFLACVMTSLPVEFAYLAYLKSKDRAYWEQGPRRASRQDRRRVARKVSVWVLGIVGAVALFWALAKFVPMWLV